MSDSGYMAWLKVLPDGRIESVVWCLGTTGPLDHPIVCTDFAQYGELRARGGQQLFWDEKLKTLGRKHDVRWLVQPGRVLGVGDRMRAELVGLPEDYRAPVPVRIGADDVSLDYPYVIDLGWENAARLSLQVTDNASIVQRTPTNVQFVERRKVAEEA